MVELSIPEAGQFLSYFFLLTIIFWQPITQNTPNRLLDYVIKINGL